MTTSNSSNGDDENAARIQKALPYSNSGGSAADFVDLDALSKLASEVMDAMPPAYKASRMGYASDIDELVLKNLPEKMKSSDFVVPTKDQLHRLPETIASGETPKTPLANRDVAMAKTMSALATERVEMLPFAFLQEIRAIVPETPEEWSAPLTNSALEIYPDLSSSPQMAALPQIQNAAASMAQPFVFLNQSTNPFVDLIPKLDPFDQQAQTAMFDTGGLSSQPFDIERIRRDFPILQEKINGHNLIWLDNAATTQKPKSVVDRLSHFYLHENSNIHRAAHELAARSTDAYEGARDTVKRFINASSSSEVIFVRGATEAINLVAQSWGRQNIQKDDEILISWLEHHANIVPWQMLCAEKGARLRVAPVDDLGQIILDEYERLLSPRTKLVAFTHVSNALGTVTPVEEMVAAAHRHGAKVLLDGAQSISHMSVDVQKYGCDFFVFSGHKVFAPTGIGVLYGKADVLDGMRPWQGGGNMIKDVTFERTSYQKAPVRFEAGTGNIADAIGLAAAIDYVNNVGMANISKHEHELMEYATAGLAEIPGLRLIGRAPNKAGVLSFVLDGFRTDEVSTALNQQGIAVRGGHHCAQPILRRFGVESSVRPSLALYNTCAEIDNLIAAIWNLKQGRALRPL